MVSLRGVDTRLERPRWRSTASYRVMPTLQIGAEINPVAEEIGPLVTWFLVTETETRPAADWTHGGHGRARGEAPADARGGLSAARGAEARR